MTSSGSIAWTNDRRKLRELVAWERNPRQIRKEQAGRLADSLDEFGQVQAIAIGPDNEIYDGHQRKNVWAALDRYGPDYEVDVRVASRPLTEKEREKLVVYLHRGAHGEWDFDILANEFEMDDLLEWGFSAWELGGSGEGDDPYELWKGMPEFEQNDAGAFQTIKVHFATREGVERFAELVQQNITNDTKWIWYPKLERMKLKQVACIDES